MDKIAIFMEGGYISKLLIQNFSSISVDFVKLANWIADGMDILRVYYYDCLPYQSRPSTPDEQRMLSRKQQFFYNLNRLPKFEVREGRLEYRGRTNTGVPIFQQKRVDIMLGVDLTRLAFKKVISHAAILSGDSDYIPAIQTAKDEGILIRLIHGPTGTYHDQLWDIVDERMEIRADILDGCRLK
jgi:uncharacterized LabA/DUF88 family protein